MAHHGTPWQSQLVIDFVRSGVSTFHHDDLRLMQFENFKQEYIRNITVFKCPLYDSQLPGPLLSDVLNHQFVILETDNWWYSIEKNGRNIYMQRSKYINDVLCCIGNIHRRTPLLGISNDICNCQPLKTMGDLIQFLHDNNELNKNYNPILSNCQAFTKRIFDKFATTKKHKIISGCSPAFQVIPPWQKVWPTVCGVKSVFFLCKN